MSTTISQRELRNDNADIMRRVEAGETFVVTRNGRPVAQVIPIDDVPQGTRRMTVGEIAREWAAMGPFDGQAWLRDARAAVDDSIDYDPWEPRR
jgi:prevent-host-death family protein